MKNKIRSLIDFDFGFRKMVYMDLMYLYHRVIFCRLWHIALYLENILANCFYIYLDGMLT